MSKRAKYPAIANAAPTTSHGRVDIPNPASEARDAAPSPSALPVPSDNGLALALLLAKDDLAELAHYFAQRIDVSDSGAPNAEMNLLAAVGRIEALHERIAAGKPAPSQVGYASGGER